MVVTRQQVATAKSVDVFDFALLEHDLRVNQNAGQLYLTCLSLQKLWPELSPQQTARVRTVFRWKVVNDSEWSYVKNQFWDTFLTLPTHVPTSPVEVTKQEIDILTSFLDEVSLSVTDTQRLCVVLELYNFLFKQNVFNRAFTSGVPAFERMAAVILMKFDYLKLESPHMAQILDNNFKEHIELVKNTYPHVCCTEA